MQTCTHFLAFWRQLFWSCVLLRIPPVTIGEASHLWRDLTDEQRARYAGAC